MIQVYKKMRIYTTSAKRAMALSRKILENEEKQNIQVFGATPSRLEGDMGYQVSVSYLDYTDKENYERNLNKAKETIQESLNSLQEKVDDVIINKLSDAIDKQVSKIEDLYKKSYIREVEASNYLHDLLEIITFITSWLLSCYESTNVKILESCNSIFTSYYCSCINVEYPIEKYIDIKDKTLSLINELRFNLNNQEQYKEINDLMNIYYDIEDKRYKDEISIDESVLEMTDCYNKLNSISKSNKTLELKKVVRYYLITLPYCLAF